MSPAAAVNAARAPRPRGAVPESAIRAAALLVRILGATWRIDRSAMAPWERELGAGARCLFAFWHARMLPLVYTHRGRGIVVLVSRHRDGEWIARTIERLGFGTVRGSSTRGGEEAMRALIAATAAHPMLAFTPDGPRGPAERVKPGVVWLASRTGLPVVPVATASSRAHVFRSWDRFRVPLPFARVHVAYGEPITVPRMADDATLERSRLELEHAIRDLTAVTAQRAGERS